MEEYTENRSNNTAKDPFPQLRDICCDVFLSTLTVIVKKRLHKIRWSSSQKIEKHIAKQAFRYLKMALSKEGEAVRAFKVIFSEVTLRVIPRISGKKLMSRN